MNGQVPAWAAFELSAASSVQGLTILSGVGRTDHHIQDFTVELKVDGSYQDTTNVQIVGWRVWDPHNVHPTITGSRVVITHSDKDWAKSQLTDLMSTLEMTFDAVTCTAVKLTVYSTTADNNNVVLNEIILAQTVA
jgi:hypothetical protein